MDFGKPHQTNSLEAHVKADALVYRRSIKLATTTPLNILSTPQTDIPSDFSNLPETKTCKNDVGFEVLTPVVMKTSSIFWDITPCSPLKVNGRYAGTCRLHLQALLAICFIQIIIYFSHL
jgi:hypothetical protein